jgi:hypothetical protein
VNKLYRNPAAWLSVMIFASLTFLFFRQFPIFAIISFGSLILYFIVIRARSAIRLHRQGYRARAWSRDDFYYEELFDGKIRRLVISGELMAKGPRVMYVPSHDEWQQKMPVWAKDRREEILNRIRVELGDKRVKYVETESRNL